MPMGYLQHKKLADNQTTKQLDWKPRKQQFQNANCSAASRVLMIPEIWKTLTDIGAHRSP